MVILFSFTQPWLWSLPTLEKWEMVKNGVQIMIHKTEIQDGKLK